MNLHCICLPGGQGWILSVFRSVKGGAMSQKEFPPAVKRHDADEAMRLTGADISTVKQALELHKDCLVFDAVSFP